MGEWFLYVAARAVIGLLQALPITWVARIGRAGGALVWWLDARHRRMALANLERCFGHEKSHEELRALARENFRRIGENFACGAKTASMSREEIHRHLRVRHLESLKPTPDRPARNTVAAIGHFGNFELYARISQFVGGYQPATTYRRLRQASLNRLLQSLRVQSGCLYFDRVTEGAALRAAMQQENVLLGLLADQHGGRSGYRLPFLGQDCSTSLAVALFALRYECRLYTAICYRVALAQWEIEVGEEVPTRLDGQPRPAVDIMRDVNRALEAGVRRDPANWFWVHNRWKSPGREPRREVSETASGGETNDDDGVAGDAP